MTLPGSIGGAAGPGSDWLERAVRDLQREVAALRTARSLQAATIGAGGITLAGGRIASADFDGDLDDATAGTAGWALGGANNNAVFNDLVLRGGIIGNAALTNPAAATAWHGEKNQFTIAESLTYYLTHTIVPPSSRYTTAAVTLIGNGSASLSNSVPQGSLYLNPAIVNGSQNINQGYLPEQSATATYAAASLGVTIAGVLTNVPPTGFDVSLAAEVSGGFASGSGNVSLSAVVIWLP